ncbi:hypothetical protein EXVG_00125 [Emiliania huxleyi virus 202]|nr:hypothetical protein EXVG_00125 [Emiliania huxleyi virus 202]AHA54414.1 putative membrane protein [Emiliania huxleyi virus 18]AHA55454.1 putative membrane protein [Emiliania huxleyi virus 156]
MAEDNSVTARFVLGLAIVAGVYMFWKMFIYKPSLNDKLRKRGYDIDEPATALGAPDIETQRLNQQREDLEKQRHNEVNGIIAHPLEPKPNEHAAVTRLRKTLDALKTDSEHQRRSVARKSMDVIKDDETEQLGI